MLGTLLSQKKRERGQKTSPKVQRRKRGRKEKTVKERKQRSRSLKPRRRSSPRMTAPQALMMMR